MLRRTETKVPPARAPEGRRTSQAVRAPQGRVAPPAPNETLRRVRDDRRDEINVGRASHPTRQQPAQAHRTPNSKVVTGSHKTRTTRTGNARLVVVDHQLATAKRDRSRMAVLVGVVLLMLGLLCARLVNVQIVQGPHWQQAAQRQSLGSNTIAASRGAIRDRYDTVLANDVPADQVVVDPQHVDNAPYYAHALAPVLGIEEERLLELLKAEKLKNGKWRRYRVISASVDANTAEIIKEMDFPGIVVEPQPRRDYPAGQLAASIMGGIQTTEFGNEGSAGVEFMFDQKLRGRPGVLVADHDVNGVAIPRSEQRNIPARSGDTVNLTLDSGIQYHAEQILVDQVRAQGARGGSVTVTDVATGDILAMASVTDGLNRSGPHVSTASQGNEAAVMGYEPGSVMKIVAISQALETSCITPQARFLVPRTMKNGPFLITDDERHPEESWTARDILTHSSNVGTAMIAQQCSRTPAEFDRWLTRFGFGRSTGLNFPGEATGRLVPVDRYGDSGLKSGAFGYGAIASPVQVLDAYATIARGGIPVTPRLALSMTDAAGKVHPTAVQEGVRVVSADTAKAMRSMLKNVVTEGTGVCASVQGYDVAGKTGTVKKRSSNSAYYASFVGFAPAAAPRVAVMVVLDDPSEQYGGKAAAPVFNEVMAIALQRMQVAPNDVRPGIPTQFDIARDHARRIGARCTVPHRDELARILAAKQAALNPPAASTTTTATAVTSTTISVSQTPSKSGPPVKASTTPTTSARYKNSSKAVPGTTAAHAKSSVSTRASGP